MQRLIRCCTRAIRLIGNCAKSFEIPHRGFSVMSIFTPIIPQGMETYYNDYQFAPAVRSW